MNPIVLRTAAIAAVLGFLTASKRAKTSRAVTYGLLGGAFAAFAPRLGLALPGVTAGAVPESTRRVAA